MLGEGEEGLFVTGCNSILKGERSLRYLQNEPGSLDAAFDWVPDAHTITLAEIQQLARELFSPETRRVNRLLVAPAGTK